MIFWSKSNSAYGNYNSPYAKGVSTTQYFIPQMSWLSGIDIVADFDENAVGNETLEFAIYDEKGKKFTMIRYQLRKCRVVCIIPFL